MSQRGGGSGICKARGSGERCKAVMSHRQHNRLTLPLEGLEMIDHCLPASSVPSINAQGTDSCCASFFHSQTAMRSI
jgi:hypothetical protein